MITPPLQNPVLSVSKPTLVSIYARVSTYEHNPEAQLLASLPDRAHQPLRAIHADAGQEPRTVGPGPGVAQECDGLTNILTRGPGGRENQGLRRPSPLRRSLLMNRDPSVHRIETGIHAAAVDRAA